MTLTIVPLLILSTLGLCALFALVYLLARRIDNYGIVDIAWSYAFAGIATFYALFGTGWIFRRALIGAMAIVWSLRLGTHLYRRVMGHHPEEDSRYRQLREDWSGNFGPKMFGFFQMQAVSVVILAAPFLLASRHAAPAFQPLEIIGALLWLFALTGESLADRQLHRFVRDPAHKGKVCDVGLWRYTRHPNYFCEWLIWVGFGTFALAAPWGWIALLSPAIMFHLLRNVTGVPMAEKSSLKSKGDAYRAYQQRTNAFFPGPTKKSA